MTNEGRATTSAPRVVFAPDRLFGVDAARGLALLGMFVAHTVITPGEKVVDGRSAILFATVAGISLGLLTGGAHRVPRELRGGLRMSIAIRGCVLIVLGVLLALLSPPLGVILDYYGFGFLLLIPVLFAGRPLLAAIGMLVVLAAPGLVALLTSTSAIEDVPLLAQPFGVWLVYGTYPVLIWVAFLLAGLIAARSDLSRRRTQLVLLAGGCVAAVTGYGAAVLIPGVTAEAHSGTIAEVVGSGGVALAVVAALTLLGTLPAHAGRAIRFILWPLAATGSMSLTLYSAHVVVLTVVRDAVRDGAGPWSYPAWVLPALVIGALAIGTVWRRWVGPGPLEAGMRLFTDAVSRRPETGPRVAP